jgi:hypothetical protein
MTPRISLDNMCKNDIKHQTPNTEHPGVMMIPGFARIIEERIRTAQRKEVLG